MFSTLTCRPTELFQASNGPVLLDRHREHLRLSGLTDDTIDEAGIFSEVDPEAIQRHLNWRKPATELGPCIVFRYRNAAGDLNGHCQLRPDNPRPNAGKYENPKGSTFQLYHTPLTLKAIKTAGAAIGFTEGVKKSLAAYQAGVPIIGLQSINGWAKAKDSAGDRLLIDDLISIDWQGRPVFILHDTDSRYNPDVSREASELARALQGRGAVVKVIWFPLGPPRQRQDPRQNGD